MDYQHKLGLIPLRNFGIVYPGKEIYRSAQPTLDFEWEWAKRMLHLEWSISFRKEAPLADHLASSKSIGLRKIPVADHHPPSLQQADDFIDFINGSDRPILIHCEHGHGRTSTFSVLTKLALGWRFRDAMQDEIDRFHYAWQHPAQCEFLHQYAKSRGYK